MKIAISGEPIETKIRKNYDGIGVYTDALHHYLPQLGVEVEPYIYAGHDELAVKSKVLPYSYGNAILRDMINFRSVVNVKADLFHFTDYHVINTSCPSVATVHDAIPLKFPDWVSPKYRKIKNFFLKRMVKKADIFVAVSQYAVNELQEYYHLPLDRIRVVNCGIEQDWLDNQPDELYVEALLTRFQLKKGYFFVVGTLQPRKNVDRIIDAYLQLSEQIQNNRQLVIVGNAGWHCEQTIKKIHNLIESGKNIKWIQNLSSRQDLKAIYSASCALIFPSLYEGFGIPVLEAFASNVPVLSSNVSSLPEVAGDAALLVDPYSVDEITHGMSLLATDESLGNQYRLLGKQRVKQFTWMKSAQVLKKIYSELV